MKKRNPILLLIVPAVALTVALTGNSVSGTLYAKQDEAKQDGYSRLDRFVLRKNLNGKLVVRQIPPGSFRSNGSTAECKSAQ